MEVKYHKDYRHNFLILKSEQITANSYQIRMLTQNEISGFLPCKERHINDEQLFYYEITSKQSLASFYECGGIHMEILCRLFVQLKSTWDAMAGYLLEEKHLVLYPEFIFMDVETKEFSFLYYPEEPEADYITLLLEFLLEKVDSEDEQAVDAVYKMLELVEKEQFVIDEIIQWFEQDYEEKADKEFLVKKDDVYEYDLTNHHKEEISFREMQNQYYVEEVMKVEEKSNHPAEKISLQCLTVNIILSVAIALGCIFVYLRFHLGKMGVLGLCISFIAALGVFSFCMVQLICRKYLFQKQNTEVVLQNEKKTQQDSYLLFEENTLNPSNQVYGNTVFIPWTESCENKLYGMGKGNKNHIDLNHLPITVGNLVGSVDMVINEQSISRRHVKFSRENGRICMTDLNSTNGTFKNGMRLLPNTSEILEAGDEIRLGKLKFIYR